MYLHIKMIKWSLENILKPSKFLTIFLFGPIYGLNIQNELGFWKRLDIDNEALEHTVEAKIFGKENLSAFNCLERNFLSLGNKGYWKTQARSLQEDLSNRFNKPEVLLGKEQHLPLKLLNNRINEFWNQETAVTILHKNDFEKFLKKKKHALVIFYSPACPHCQSTKPEFSRAAKAMKTQENVAFAAVDCLQDGSLCDHYNIRGYPTMLYFNYMKRKVEYNGGRKAEDFVNFMKKNVS